MITLLGSSGYVGQAFQQYFRARCVDYIPISRSQVDYYNSKELAELIRQAGATFLINAAGYTGKPNVDACERNKADCLMGNVILPSRVRIACEIAGIAWAHISSGCVYNGKNSDGSGFTELDPPNFNFRSGHCSFYSGTKALGEELLDEASCYIWRLRMPFSSSFDTRNYLAKLITYERLLEGENSLSHLSEFVAACHRCFELRLPFGIYNLTNPGSITTRKVVEIIQQHLECGKDFQYFKDDVEFLQVAAIAPRSNCLLDTSKQKLSGLHMSPIEEAIRRCLANWEGPHKRKSPEFHRR